ncbi:MAG: Gfo/Idh/MocA family oxidoreductase [Ignavibacteriales bacterium]|nr:Gfo/Idh/MocA family oxidoreductase [Ignavibacteriales bacterium]
MNASATKVRYGIIGFGSFAERAIAPAIQASPNSDLVAIQKRSLAVAKEKAAAFSIPHAFSTAEELVAHPDVDAVFIVSANALHHKETLAAANAGKHVLVEKPIATSVQEADEMIAACTRHNVKFMVGHMIRFSPLARRIKQLIHSGTLGNISFIKSEFFYDARLSHRGWLIDPRIAGGGPIFDIGVHCLDTMRFVLDEDVISIRSLVEPRLSATTTEITANLSLRFSKGTLGSIFCSYASSARRSFIEIIGTEGIVSAPDFTLGDRTIPLSISLKNDTATVDPRIEEIQVPNLYIKEITAFSKSILENTESPIPGTIGLENQKVLDKAIREEIL